jgi:carbamoyl-phosphate synthase small subunit
MVRRGEKMKGYLVLEDGTIYEGQLFGALDAEDIGEVVFNTSMTGYQEVLTDPSYYGQIVVMTYPLIGNYGVNAKYNQSDSIKVKGFAIKEKAPFYSHWEGDMSLDDFLKENNIIGIEGISTRSITKKIRKGSTLKGKIVKSKDNLEQLIKEIKSFENLGSVAKVTTKESYIVQGNQPDGKKIAVVDFGIKDNIIMNLKNRAKELKVFNADFTIEAIDQYNPDGLFLSNGPGDPKELMSVVEKIKVLVKKYPTFGICLGHQLISLGFGLDTQKMKFGHRGANHPVIWLKNNKVFITAQNHGYEVVGESDQVDITFKNVNDNTIEGLELKGLPVFSVQFHPEASPGPFDSLFLFDEFFKMMEVA